MHATFTALSTCYRRNSKCHKSRNLGAYPCNGMEVAQSSLRKSSFLKISFSDAISFNQETLEPMEALIGSALR